MPQGTQEVVQVGACLLDKDFVLAITAAAIALVSVVIGALLDHLLSLRAERIKRERDRAQRELAALTEGTRRFVSVEHVPLRIPGADDIEVSG